MSIEPRMRPSHLNLGRHALWEKDLNPFSFLTSAYEDVAGLMLIVWNQFTHSIWSLSSVLINTDDLKHRGAHYDVTVMDSLNENSRGLYYWFNLCCYPWFIANAAWSNLRNLMIWNYIDWIFSDDNSDPLSAEGTYEHTKHVGSLRVW